MRWIKRCLVALGVLALIGGAAFLGRHELLRLREGLPAFTHGAGARFHVDVPMRDGVSLFTTVQLPIGSGPFPAVLIRSPYAEVERILRDLLCGRFVRYGYACVFQDTRGQGRSAGDWDPGGGTEIPDGRDTLDWLVAQDFQDGNIAMVGSSYLASVQFAAIAGGAPPELRTIVPSMYATDNRTVMYQDGLFRHETYTAWASMMRNQGSQNISLSRAGADYQKALRHRPHNAVDTAVYGMAMPWYQDMLTAASPSAPYWQTRERVMLRELPEHMNLPVLMVGGFYDVFFGPQLEAWQRLASRSRSRYIIGPWTHPGGTGDLPTPNAEGGRFQWAAMLPWLAHHLKGAPLDMPLGLSLYVMGDGAWQQHAQWPSPSGEAIFHLDALEMANGCEGGRLGDAPVEGSITFTYDPDDPVPTRGGAGMLAFNLPGFNGAQPANVDQAGLCERDDVLTFQSAPFTDSLLISGDIEVELEVASSAPDTAFTAKLIEVFPDGRAFNIRDTITSLAYRNGAEQPRHYTPGARVTVTLDFWPIAWRIQPGSRLRLDVSSSDFPKFHAHTNRAGPWAEQTGADIAQQTVFGGRVRLDIGR